jgi:hypothetical protein
LAVDNVYRQNALCRIEAEGRSTVEARPTIHMTPLIRLSNQSGHTMVAYTLRWEVMRNGQREITFCQAKYPDAVAAAVPVRGNEVRAGERIICGMSIELDCGQ